MPDRHGGTESYFGSPLNLLAILARETHRVALGSYCLVNTLYHPMHLAEQCAIIDNLSRGRLYMTWGRGYHSGYWGQFGVPEQRLLGRFLDGVRLIEKALLAKGQRFDWDSEFHQVRGGLLSPNSWQQPRFPFWGGGQLPAAIERCGEYADAWTCDQFPILPEVWQQQAGALPRGGARAGEAALHRADARRLGRGQLRAGRRRVRHALRRGDALLLPAGDPRASPGTRHARENHRRGRRASTS